MYMSVFYNKDVLKFDDDIKGGKLISRSPVIWNEVTRCTGWLIKGLLSSGFVELNTTVLSVVHCSPEVVPGPAMGNSIRNP